MTDGVSERARREATGVLDAGVLQRGPGEEVVDEPTRGELSASVALRGSQMLPGVLELEELSHPKQRLTRGRLFGHDRGFPCAPSAVAPAADFEGCLVLVADTGIAAEDGVVDGVGVGLDVAGEAAEHLADGGARVLGLELEEDVVPVGEHDEEVAFAERRLMRSIVERSVVFGEIPEDC